MSPVSRTLRISFIAASLVTGIAVLPSCAQPDDARDALNETVNRFHQAFDRADLDALSELLTDDAAIVSAGGHDLSREDILKTVAELNEERPGLSMRLTTTDLELGPSAWGLGSESGTWVERWPQDYEANILTGKYHAIWRRDGEDWRLSALLLVPLECSGPYCN